MFGLPSLNNVIVSLGITMKENTKRPETIEDSSNNLAGTGSDKILEAAKISYAKTKTRVNPFGDGKPCSKIINILMDKLK
jgi:UDP-N-acetylglucosamine 2-epimerase (non-hydrolysing)